MADPVLAAQLNPPPRHTLRLHHKLGLIVLAIGLLECIGVTLIVEWRQDALQTALYNDEASFLVDLFISAYRSRCQAERSCTPGAQDPKKNLAIVESLTNELKYGPDRGGKQPGYYFVYTYAGCCVAHGASHDMIGLNLNSVIDIDGKPVLQGLQNGANSTEQPPPLIPFEFFTPETLQQLPAHEPSCDGGGYVVGNLQGERSLKLALAKNLPPADFGGQQMFVGTGLYKNQVGDVVGGHAQNRANRKLRPVFWGILLLVLGAAIFTGYFGLRVAAAIVVLAEHVRCFDPETGDRLGATDAGTVDAVSSLAGRGGEIADLAASFEFMMRNTRDRYGKLKQKTNEYEALFNSVSDVLVVTDSNDEIVHANRKAELYFGANLIGKSIYEVIPEAERDEYRRDLAKVLMGMTVEKDEVQRRTAQGKMVPLRIAIAPVQDGQGQVEFRIHLGTDLTHQKEFMRRKRDGIGATDAALQAANDPGNPPRKLERRQVVVLFADLVGSTPLSISRGPERFGEIISDYYQEMVDLIHEGGGIVDKFTGDGVMAYFGNLSGTARDDAERCVLTALKMQKAMTKLNACWQLQEQLKQRIGIDCGFATGVFLHTTRRVDYTLIGDCVNKASRVEKTCEAGRVRITHDAYVSVKDCGFRFGPPERANLEGTFGVTVLRYVDGALDAAAVVPRAGEGTPSSAE